MNYLTKMRILVLALAITTILSPAIYKIEASSHPGTCSVEALTPPLSKAEEKNVQQQYCQDLRNNLPAAGYKVEWVPNDGTGLLLLSITTSGYKLLAPLPDPFSEGQELGPIDTAADNALGNYLNVILRLAIGLAAVLAVVMIVIGGIEYMTSELVSGKAEGKKRITNAILGLLVALGAYLILFTINPDLLDTNLKIDPATIAYTADEVNFEKTERPVASAGGGYQLSGSPSAGVSTFIQNNLAGTGQSLRNIIVDTNNNKAIFTASNGQSVTIPINIGSGGVSASGQATGGDLKTPRGVTSITSDIRISRNSSSAILSRNGVYNLGAAFINIGATYNGSNRGIGFHGGVGAGLGGVTNGCIRMTNDDLKVLAPYMKQGTQILIQ